MHRKAVPKGVAPDLERRLLPHLLDQPVNVGADRLAGDRKDPLVLPKLPQPQVALDPGLKVSIQDRDKALGRALQAAFARPPCPLFERFEDHAKVVAVVDETRRCDGQHLGDTRRCTTSDPGSAGAWGGSRPPTASAPRAYAGTWAWCRGCPATTAACRVDLASSHKARSILLPRDHRDPQSLLPS